MYKPEDEQQSGRISGTEYSILLDVLDNYSIEAVDISKVGDGFRVYTSDGDLFLRRIRHGRDSIQKLSSVAAFLSGKGFYSMPRYVKTRDERLFVKHRHSYYYMTDYLEGTGININDPQELMECLKTLIEFHRCASGIEGARYFQAPGNLKNWPLIFMEHCSKLSWYKRIIEKKNIQSDFDKSYYLNIDLYRNLGMKAMELLNRSNFHILSENAAKHRSIFINKLSGKNLICSKEGKVYILDISTAEMDTATNSLGRIIRKVMKSDNYLWKFEGAGDIIEYFREAIDLSEEDIMGLLAFIIFPFEFCKIGRKRYEKHKYWSEEKYMKKLDKQLKYRDLTLKFLDDYAAYYKIDINN